MSLKQISTASTFEENFSYSRAIVDEHYVFVSGTTGYDYKAMSISDAVAEQAEQCFRNIQAVLQEAGSSLDEAVRVNYILPHRDDFALCRSVIQKYLHKSKPACTVFFAELLDEKMKIEIEITARVPQSA